MSVVKNQHYVAQGYLRNFADAGESLFAFDKKSQKSFQTAVRNVASEKFFYDLPVSDSTTGGDPQAIEKFLAQTVDADFPKAISALIDGVEQQGCIGPALKTPLACFLAVQLTRTRSLRTSLTQMSDALISAIRKSGPVSTEFEKRYKLDEKAAAAVQARFFLDPAAIGQIAAVLSGHFWIVGVSTTGRAFYTSDNPVVKKANASHPVMGMSGLASPGIEIAFPLTPKYVLLLYERTFFGDKVGKHDLRAVGLPDEGVAHCNTMQVLGSRRQVYCPVDDFDLPRDVCKMYPETCDPDRAEFQVVSGGERQVE
ncbi:hypothetical protein AYO44_08870 [Planctomycetaceae bacterium SCGC AG-212-F19]|nr:hypothetical protein AYO44_08870 [Planctomycetaceae bacterium SCGC AG-212-F19]